MAKSEPIGQDPWKIRGDSDLIDDPIADCLVIVAKIHGRPISRARLRAGLPLINNKLTVQLSSRAARRAGLASRVLKRPLQEITSLGLPCILLYKDGKAVVLVKKDSRTGLATLVMPESGGGSKIVPLQKLEKRYTGYTIFAQPEFHKDKASLAKSGGPKKNWFRGTLFSSWRIYRDVLLASFLINVFALATPFFILNVYDRVIPNDAFETLWVLAIGIGGIYLFSLLMISLRAYFVDVAGQKADRKLSSMIFEKALGLKMSARPESIGAFATKIQQIDTIRDFMTSLAITALVDLPFALFALGAIWYLAGNIVLIHVVAILLLVLYAASIQVPLQKSVGQAFAASARKSAVLVEGLNGLETLKMLGAEGKIQHTWEEAVGHLSRWSAYARCLSSSASHLSKFVMNVTILLVIIAGVYSLSEGHLSQGGLIAIILLTQQAVSPIAQCVGLAMKFNGARTSLKTLEDVMAMSEERPPQASFLHRSGFSGKIAFKDVTLTYPGQRLPVLKNISFTITPGERLGIIGGIGSGKTTLSRMFTGLYEPDSGLVSIDGTDIRQIDPIELRRFIGCVPQDVTLIRGSVKDNIALGCDLATEADILRAVALAGLSELVTNHPMGLDMPVGEQGRMLSGGERQMVAIARTLLLDPGVLILDEPSSFLDIRTERELRRKLVQQMIDKTLILITHRASLLAMVNRLIVLSRGQIRADGPRDSILQALKNKQIRL